MKFFMHELMGIVAVSDDTTIPPSARNKVGVVTERDSHTEIDAATFAELKELLFRDIVPGTKIIVNKPNRELENGLPYAALFHKVYEGNATLAIVSDFVTGEICITPRRLIQIDGAPAFDFVKRKRKPVDPTSKFRYKIGQQVVVISGRAGGTGMIVARFFGNDDEPMYSVSLGFAASDAWIVCTEKALQPYDFASMLKRRPPPAFKIGDTLEIRCVANEVLRGRVLHVYYSIGDESYMYALLAEQLVQNDKGAFGEAGVVFPENTLCRPGMHERGFD